jgi:hypothetical protein
VIGRAGWEGGGVGLRRDEKEEEEEVVVVVVIDLVVRIFFWLCGIFSRRVCVCIFVRSPFFFFFFFCFFFWEMMLEHHSPFSPFPPSFLLIIEKGKGPFSKDKGISRSAFATPFFFWCASLVVHSVTWFFLGVVLIQGSSLVLFSWTEKRERKAEERWGQKKNHSN